MSASSHYPSSEHASLIVDQFTRQAAGFAVAPELHNDEVLDLVVKAAGPQPTDTALDVACGPGSVALALAAHVKRVDGLDATDAMLEQARSAAAARGVTNASWRSGSVYALPYENASFDIVVCRFAVHHFENLPAAMDEMRRVAASGARIVVCDSVASDDSEKARAFNEMERWRDPSTVEFRNLAYLIELYRTHGLKAEVSARFQVPYLAQELVERSFPANDDRAGLLALIERSVEGDRLGMQAKHTPAGTQIAFQSVVLVATVL